MTETNKKLTVALGTFSCTLQGFDDPLPIMKEVADYFQQLADAHPAFGAEPQPEDLAALSAIATSVTGQPATAELHDGATVIGVAEQPATPTADPAPEAPVAEVSTDLAWEDYAVAGVATAPDDFGKHDTEDSPTPEASTTENDETLPNWASELISDVPPNAMVAENTSPAADAKASETGVVESVETAPSTAPEHDLALERSAENTVDAQTAPLDLAEEEAAIERMLDAERTDTQQEPKLSPSNPLARLRSKIVASASALAPQRHNPASEDQSATTGIDAKDTDKSTADVSADPDADVATSAVPTTESAVADPSGQAPVLTFPNQITDTPALSIKSLVDAEATDLPTPSGATAAPEEPAHGDADKDTDTFERLEAEAMATLGLTPADKAEPKEEETGVHDLPPLTDLPDPETDEARAPLSAAGQAFVAALGETAAQPAPPLAAEPPAASAEPVAAEGSPLKLSSGQIIADKIAKPEQAGATDEPQEDPGTLRLVPAEAGTELADTGDADTQTLRAFASAMGAASLPELLEASAAYVTLIGNRPSFSRREIFDLFDTLNGDKIVSHEARIKTFSRLLRSGVIERTQDGSFSMSRAARAQYEDRASA